VWVFLPIEDIIAKYNQIWSGILHYYSFAYNRSQLNVIQFILEHSLACTLANKLKLRSRRKVFKQFGRPIKHSFSLKVINGKEVKKEISFNLVKPLKRINSFSRGGKHLPYGVFYLPPKLNGDENRRVVCAEQQKASRCNTGGH
jgi:hypothetical protein